MSDGNDAPEYKGTEDIDESPGNNVKDAVKDQSGSNKDDGTEPSSSAQPVGPSANECAFCLDDMASDDEVIPQGCPHISHKKCLLRWLKASRACQNCRAPITKVTMKKSGKTVKLPKLDEPKPGDFHYVEPPPPNDEEFVNAPITTSEDEEDSDFEPDNRRRRRRVRGSDSEDQEQPSRNNDMQNVSRRRRQPDRSRRVPSARDAMISSMADFISGFVGSSRGRGRGGTVRVRPAPAARTVAGSRRHDGTMAGSSTRRPIQGGRWELVCEESDEESAQSTSGQDSDDDEVEVAERSDRRAQRRQRSRRPSMADDSDREEPTARRKKRRVIVSSESEVSEVDVENVDEEASESESSEDSNTGSEEGSGDSMDEDSELDESVLEDQPSTSRQMAPIVRKTRGAKKRKGTKKKRKTTKRTTKKRTTTKRRKTKRVSRKKGRKHTSAEDASELRRRIDATRLSLNGAGIEPLTDEEADREPPVKRRAPLPTPPTVAADPTDLLGSILSEQVVAHAPGRYLEQRDGRLVPGEKFSRHLDRLQSRGVPVDRVGGAQQSSSSAPSAPPAPTRSTSTFAVPDSAPRLVPLSTGPRLPPPPPPSSSSGYSSRLRDEKIEALPRPGSESSSSRAPLDPSSATVSLSRQRDSHDTPLSRGFDVTVRPSSSHSNGATSSTFESRHGNGSRHGSTSGSHGNSRKDKSRKEDRRREDRKKSSKSHRSSGSSSHRHSSSSSSIPHGSSNHLSSSSLVPVETPAQMIERHNRERFATLRRLSTQVTNEEVAAGRITPGEQERITTRVSLYMLRIPIIEEAQVRERTLMELGSLIEQKMFPSH